MTRIEITTRDGTCPAYAYRPAGRGPWPAALMYMDGIGIRPAMLEAGEHLASLGYLVLLPDLYYRAGPYAPMDGRTLFSNPESRKMLMEKFFPVASQALIMADTRAFLDWIAAQPDAKRGKVGTVGYCMGGVMAFASGGHYPDRIAATASYHPGRLATDAPDSPHLLAPKIKGRVYIGAAMEDQSFPDDMKARLGEALTSAHVDHTLETYEARHGFCFHDTPSYDASANARHWKTLTALFGATIGGAIA